MRNSTRLFLIPVLILFMGLFNQLSAQCEMTSSYGSGTVDSGGAVTTISTCNYTSEYSTVNGLVSGDLYEFTCTLSGTHKYVTIRDAASGGAVLGHGASPYLYTSTVTGTVYAHWSDDALCATSTGCHVTTVQYIPSVGCGDTYAGSLSPTETSQTVAYASGDSYYWAFDYQDTYVYSFSSCGAGEDTYVRLYDNTGTLIASNDDNGVYCSGTAASLEWTAVGSGTAYISLAHYSCNSMSNAGNFEFYYTSCNPPAVDATTGITQSEATLNWTSSGTLFHVKYNGGADFDPTTAGTAVTPDPILNTATLTGLSGSTEYFWYIQNDCSGSTSTWAGPYTFVTSCGAFTLPYSQTFDGTSTPLCWSQSAASGGPWVFSGTPGYAAATAGDNTGNGGSFGWIDFSGTDAAVVLETPDFDITGATNPTLAFYYFSHNTNNTDINFLYVEAWDGAAWVSVATLNEDNGGWTSYSYGLSAFTYNTSMVKLRFRGESGGGSGDYNNDLLLDDVSVYDNNLPPPCSALTAPTDLSIDLPVDVDLSWASSLGATGYYLYVGTDNPPTNIVNGTDLGSVTSYSLLGLSYSTTYYWQVAPYNANGTATGCDLYQFTVMANPTQSIPFVEDWETGAIPWFWQQTDLGTYTTMQVDAGAAYNGSYGIEMYADNSTYSTPSGMAAAWTNAQPGGSNDFHTHYIDVTVDLGTATNPVLSFNYAMGYQYNDNYNNFWVLINDGTGWLEHFAVQTAGGATPFTGELQSLSGYVGDIITIRFFHNNKYATNYLHLDDIEVFDDIFPPSCSSLIAPADVSTDTPVDVDFTWQPSLGASGYYFYLGTDNPPTTLVNGTDIGNVTTFTQLGLDYLTTYYWQVVPYNVNGPAVSCSVSSFTTMSQPSNNTCDYTVELIDSYGDGWNGGMLSISVGGIPVLTNATVVSGAGPVYYTFSVFDAGAIVANYSAGSWSSENEYYVYDADGALIFSDGVSGTPAAVGNIGNAVCPTCDYNVELYDSYGDGWNGGEMSVFVDGMEVLTNVTLASGSGPAIYTFAAYTGAEITTTYSAGGWSYENSYAIFDGNTVLMYQSTAPPAASAIAGFADCSLAPPTCTSYSAPADGGILVDVAASLSWNAPLGVTDGYLLYIGTDNPPTNLINGTDVGNVLTYAATLDYFTTYYWQVIPYNVLGVAAGCDVVSFTTLPDPAVTYPGDDCTSALDYGLINDPAVFSQIDYPYDVEWYSFTVPVDYENVSVSLCGSSFDTKLEVWDDCNASGYLYYNDDNYSACGPGYNSQIDIAFLSAGTYYAKAYGYGSNYGDFVLEITGTEYIPAWNVGILDILSPVSGAFIAALQPVTIELVNTGSSDITNFELSYVIDGGTPVVETYTGTILAGTTAMFSFAVLADITTSGFHQIDVYANLLNDYYPADNSMSVVVENFVGCYWSVDLQDSYGDGWNGGYLEVLVNGAPLYSNLTFTNGLSQTFDIPVYDGDMLNVTYHAGQFSSENSYVIYDGFGNVVFTDGSNGTPSPAGYSTTTSCAAVVYGCIDPLALNYDVNANVDNGSCEYIGEDCTTALDYGLINDPSVMGNNSNTGQMWYTFTLGEEFVNVEVSLCGSSFDTYLDVYDMCGGTILGSNDDFCGVASQVDFATLSAGTYYVMVAGSNSESGDYVLEISGTAFSQTLPQFPWDYVLTGANHTLLIPQTASINYNNGTISNGDYIGVFFDNGGVLTCSGYAEWNSTTTSLAAWGDDNQTPDKDGFATGEEFQWKIWNAVTGDIYDATATYMPFPVMPNEQFFAANGMSGVSALNGFVADYQQIDLAQGWSLFSTYIDPFNAGISDMFSGIVNDVEIVKNDMGLTYWPVFGVDLIGSNIIGEGYQVKMINSAVLEVVGIAVVPELTPIALGAGWSMFGYLRTTPIPIATVLSGIDTDIVLVKNSVGNIYWPLYGVNMIVNMYPGQGYQVKMAAANSFTYPANGAVSTAKAEFDYELNYYTDIVNTGNSMTVGLPLNSWDVTPSIGDEIAIVSESGDVLGASVYTGENIAISVWGDDEVTSVVEGISEGESFQVRIWNHTSFAVSSIEVTNWIEGSNSFELNGISVAGKVIFTDNLSQSVLHQNVPNPFVDITRINFDLREDMNAIISIYNLLGEKLMVVSARDYKAGQNSVEINASHLAAGTYLYKISGNKFIATKSMVIER